MADVSKFEQANKEREIGELWIQVRKEWGEKSTPLFQLCSFSTTQYGASSDGMRYLISPGRVGRSRSPRYDRQEPNRSLYELNNF